MSHPLSFFILIYRRWHELTTRHALSPFSNNNRQEAIQPSAHARFKIYETDEIAHMAPVNLAVPSLSNNSLLQTLQHHYPPLYRHSPVLPIKALSRAQIPLVPVGVLELLQMIRLPNPIIKGRSRFSLHTPPILNMATHRSNPSIGRNPSSQVRTFVSLRSKWIKAPRPPIS